MLGWLFGWLAGRVWVVVLFGRPGWPGLSSGWPVVQGSGVGLVVVRDRVVGLVVRVAGCSGVMLGWLSGVAGWSGLGCRVVRGCLAGRVWSGLVGSVLSRWLCVGWVVVRCSRAGGVGSVLVGGSRDLVGFGWLCVGPGGRGTGWSFGCRVGGWSGSGLESGGVWGVVHLCFLWFLCWSGWCLGSVFFSWVAVFFGWEHYPSRIEILYRKNKICDKVSQVVFFCCRDCLSFWRYVNGYE